MTMLHPALKKNRSKRRSHILAIIFLISLTLFLLLLYPSLRIVWLQSEVLERKAEQMFQTQTIPLQLSEPGKEGEASERTLELELQSNLNWQIKLDPNHKASVTGVFPSSFHPEQAPGDSSKTDHLTLFYSSRTAKMGRLPLVQVVDKEFEGWMYQNALSNPHTHLSRSATFAMDQPRNLSLLWNGSYTPLTIEDSALKDHLTLHSERALQNLVQKTSNTPIRSQFELNLYSSNKRIQTELPEWFTFTRSLTVHWIDSYQTLNPGYWDEKEDRDLDWNLVNDQNLSEMEQLTFTAPRRLDTLRLFCTAPLAKHTLLPECETFKYPQTLPAEVGLILHLPSGELRVNDSPSVQSWVEVRCQEAEMQTSRHVN